MTQHDLFAQRKTRRTTRKSTPPAAPPTRTLPAKTLELFAAIVGTQCFDRGVWDGLTLAHVVFNGGRSNRLQTDDCPPDPLLASQMVHGMLKLLGVNSKSDNGYGSNYQQVARWLERDIKDFGPKQPRQANKSGRRATKHPS